MKNKQIVMMAALTAMAAGSALAGNVTVLTSTDPGGGALIGIDAGTSASREVNHTDTQKFLLGQSFTVPGGGYQLGEVFLKSSNSKNFTNFVGNFQISIYQGEGAGASLLGTSSFDMASFTDGDTNTAYDVEAGDWVRFTLDGGGINLPAAGNYSFLMFWEDSSGANSRNKWGFYRSPNPGDVYAGGVQYEDTTFAPSDWPVSAWASTTAANDGVRDLGFYVGETLTGNSPPEANDLSKTVYENSSVGIVLTGSDLDGDALTFSVATPPANGVLTGTEPNMTYTPTNGVGTDSFTYTANDGITDSTPATVSITVEADLGLIAGIISDEGVNTPTGNIHEHVTHEGASGYRILEWGVDPLKHPVIGQTFEANVTAVAEKITLKLRSTETFGDYDTKSFHLKVFEGGLGSTNELATFEYNATSLGSVASGRWLSFGLGNGIEMTQGVLYSFLLAMGADDAEHRLNFERNKVSSEYGLGDELRGANLYDVENFLSDPWDVETPVGSSVVVSAGDLIMTVSGTPGSAPSPYENWITLYGLIGAETNLTADLEPDGMNNLLEYALGGNPTNDDAAAILPTSVVEGDFLNYVYNRQNPADPKLSYEVLSSTDLVNEQIETATDFAGASAPVDGIESATNQVSTTTEGEQFMQLKVEFAD